MHVFQENLLKTRGCVMFRTDFFSKGDLLKEIQSQSQLRVIDFLLFFPEFQYFICSSVLDKGTGCSKFGSSGDGHSL